jgi:hypothetical protein
MTASLAKPGRSERRSSAGSVPAQRPARHAWQLGIDLASKRETEVFKWLLACLLFGKPIQAEIAARAFQNLIRARLTSPDAMMRAGWDRLVALLDEAHYVRYDFSTASKLLEVCRDLKARYGTVTDLLEQADSPSQLSRKLQEFKHIGPVTARIFLRDVQPIWFGGPKSRRKRAMGSGK